MASSAKQAAHGLRRDSARFEPAVGDQRAQDQSRARVQVLAANGEQQRALLGG
jgi:hypothetical protein